MDWLFLASAVILGKGVRVWASLVPRVVEVLAAHRILELGILLGGQEHGAFSGLRVFSLSTFELLLHIGFPPTTLVESEIAGIVLCSCFSVGSQQGVLRYVARTLIWLALGRAHVRPKACSLNPKF